MRLTTLYRHNPYSRLASSGSRPATVRARSTMTLACFQVASSCILPSIITAPLPSGIASRMRSAKAHFRRVRAEHALGDADLGRVQRPGAGAAEQEGVAELGFAGLRRPKNHRTVRRRPSGRWRRTRRPSWRWCSARGPAARLRGSRPSTGSERTLYSGWPPPTRVVFIARDAARSAGPRLIPCIRGATAVRWRRRSSRPLQFPGWRGSG